MAWFGKMVPGKILMRWVYVQIETMVLWLIMGCWCWFAEPLRIEVCGYWPLIVIGRMCHQSSSLAVGRRDIGHERLVWMDGRYQVRYHENLRIARGGAL